MKAQMTRMQNEMDDAKARAVSMQEEMDSMKTRLAQFQEMEARCEYLEKSMKILIDERKWEYSAPDIPTSHWDERGFDQDYIAGMEEFLMDIKRDTFDLRNEGVDDNNWISLGNEGSDATALIHDDALIPHWKELTNAMQLYQEGKSFKLSLNNIQLSASVIDLLKPVLKLKPVISIVLQNNSFVNIREGIEFAVEVMESNETIQTFYWENNLINSMEDARHLVDSIISHPSIDKIRLDHCFGGDGIGYDVLRPLFTSNKNFTYIDLDNNNIRTGGGTEIGGTEISDYLASNPPLKKLFLANNNLNDEDAVSIACALKHNTNLQFISLNLNQNITDVGEEALGKAIYNPTSLNSLADCNHTCRINSRMRLSFGNDIPTNVAGCTPKQRMARKMYHLLSVRNRDENNVHHFNLEFGDDDENDESLKLVPKVLESVHRYAVSRVINWESTDYVPPLSVVYEILRGWKMPELYEPR